MNLGIDGRLEQLSSREKVMLASLAGAFLLFLAFLGYLLVGTTLGEMEDSVARRKAAIETIDTLKDRFMEGKSSGIEATDDKLQSNNLKLTPYVEGAAEKVGIQVEDYKERRVPIGKKRKLPNGDEVPEMWEELLTITFKQVDLDHLTRFLDEVDRPPELIFVKKLSMKSSWAEKSQFRVTVTLATYKKA